MDEINFCFENFNVPFEKNPNDYIRCGQELIGNFLNSNKLLFTQNNRVFTFSPIVDSMFDYKRKNVDSPIKFNAYSLNEKPDNYIISTGVGFHPNDWTKTSSNQHHVLGVLNPTYLADLQNNKALLLIDQSHEGYHVTWLWKYFHEECSRLGINPSQIIYLTGNQEAEEDYNNWYEQNRNQYFDKLNIIPSTSLLYLLLQNLLTDCSKFDDILKHKNDNIKEIKLFDCINKRHRIHRIYNYVYLNKAQLLSEGKISMDIIDENLLNLYELKKYNLTLSEVKEAIKLLPLWIDEPNTIKDFFFYETRILSNLYLNTWVSLITEASYFNYENTIFVSEKTFKPMLCMQPFIICGSKGVLKKIKDLGFKTFHPFIDENYDNLDDKDRFQAICESVNKIRAIPNKIEWYKHMRPILEHNYNLCMSYKKVLMPEHRKIIEVYNSKFKHV